MEYEIIFQQVISLLDKAGNVPGYVYFLVGGLLMLLIRKRKERKAATLQSCLGDKKFLLGQQILEAVQQPHLWKLDGNGIVSDDLDLRVAPALQGPHIYHPGSDKMWALHSITDSVHPVMRKRLKTALEDTMETLRKASEQQTKQNAEQKAVSVLSALREKMDQNPKRFS